MPYRERRRQFFLMSIALALLILAGCSGQPQRQKLAGADVYVAIDAPDETVESYVPIDDGKPLTREELAAFHSTGELDRNLSVEEKQQVELFFKSYVHNYRSTIERYLKRSELYVPFVEQVFRDRGMPVELACLVFVESGFNPNAVSRAGAGGMWQFMPFTGRKYGLAQNRWLDERRDPYKATHAAAEYLAKLHDFFDGDWHLAIAAYNAGEGKIGRALAGTDSKSFFEICRKNDMLDDKAQLRAETQQYLPRFLAFTKIMRNLELLGFLPPRPDKALKLAAVDVPAGVDLTQFAREINLDWEQFKGFNPAYLRRISPPSAKSVARVPENREKAAEAWLGRKDVSLYAGWREYKVKRGDSLGRIARRTGATVSLLRKANNKKNNTLRIGEYLLVPGSTRAARSTLAKVAPESLPFIPRTKDGKPAAGYSGRHAVVSGDTLFELALAWGTTVDDICLLNDIEPDAPLKIDQQLYIPSGKNIGGAFTAGGEEQTPEARPAVSPAVSPDGERGTGKYVVIEQGDTLLGLAKEHGCTVADICKANGITPRTRLAVGRELYILPGAANASRKASSTATLARSRDNKADREPAAPKGTVAVIQAGDTLYSLARTYGTSVAAIAKRNGISPKAKLRLGQVIYLP